MNMVSAIQCFNENYLQNFFSSVRWKDLKKEERKQFEHAFVEKALTDSNLSDEIE